MVSVSKQPGSDVSFYISSTQQNVTNGIAPGHNLIQWKKPEESTSPMPIVGGVSIDTGVFRNSGASIRIDAANTGKAVRNLPITATVGQVVTVSFWILTDSNWNGTGSNSKIRFSSTDGSLLSACSFNGVKTTWTFFTCSRTLNSANTTINATIGNDGTVGNIWLDDISLSLQ